MSRGIELHLPRVSSDTAQWTGEPTVLLGAGIDDARARVGELGQFHTVLLAQQALVVAAILDVVDLDRLVALRRHAQLARVVEVD